MRWSTLVNELSLHGSWYFFLSPTCCSILWEALFCSQTVQPYSCEQQLLSSWLPYTGQTKRDSTSWQCQPSTEGLHGGASAGCPCSPLVTGQGEGTTPTRLYPLLSGREGAIFQQKWVMGKQSNKQNINSKGTHCLLHLSLKRFNCWPYLRMISLYLLSDTWFHVISFLFSGYWAPQNRIQHDDPSTICSFFLFVPFLWGKKKKKIS